MSYEGCYVLAVKTRDQMQGETYWTGKMTVAEMPSMSLHLENAATWLTAREAYDAGRRSKSLSLFRAVRPRPQKYYDGFINRWWRK